MATKKVDYSHDLIMEEALGFIDRSAQNPFFLYVALTIPHANNEAGRKVGDGQEVPDYGIYKEKDWTKQNKGQAAMITRMDTGVGQILDRLVHRPVLQTTGRHGGCQLRGPSNIALRRRVLLLPPPSLPRHLQVA